MATEVPLPPQHIHEDGSDVDDADVEETADEAPQQPSNGAPGKKKRRLPRRLKQFSDSTPSTPKIGTGSPITRRFPTLPRRATMPNPNERGALRGERIDYLKSTELMGELRAGAPAVVMFASMLQRDEHGHKKIPVLLEQVRVDITDSVVRGDSERHTLFTIHLEYGNGPNRMIWTVKKSIGDIVRMHLKYKGSVTTERLKRPKGRVGLKQPKFPTKAFPYLRSLKGMDFSDDEDENRPPETTEVATIAETVVDATAGEATAGEMTAAEGTCTEAEGRPSNKRRKASRMNVLSPRRNTMGEDASGAALDHAAKDAEESKRKYAQFQRRSLEKYLREMVRWLMFRPDSNRLCRFFELSALGVRLAAEGGYHGKEGHMQIRPANGIINPAKSVARRDRKWFLVRQSYIACVDSPESIDIHDVFLVDPKFDIVTKKGPKQTGNKNSKNGKSNQDGEDDDFLENPQSAKKNHHHKLTITNSERKIKLYAQQHDLPQFEESIRLMKQNSPWASDKIRFESFAPVRNNVFAQWLVDGRDYMWNVSRALSMAKDVIYIHDWWLSPELYMRRPPCISQRWRLDRLLQQKAIEGVKIFIIVYRNVEAAIPIDSEYTKRSLLNLHPNIFVQRSPNQYKKNQYFFAHHEKICIVDHYLAFVGGIDLCFGRWDTPQHLLTDDKPTGFEPDEVQNVPRDSEHVQMFPGKDYSNPRIQDFFRLDQPYEEMYDRSKTPRMPWHDVSMQVVGQPARDLTRHFVQRWNYLRRGRKPTRPLPFLLPPPDFREEDLEALGLTGTCEVQILRSATTWSLGIQHTECSIQNAYLQMIEKSEHFVYMENQFFVTSTEALGVPIVNKIGDALVDRIKRAYENDEDWKCVVLIPLMPGFQNTVAESEGTSVRLIMECQYQSICRGEASIFGRLRAAGIDPEDYIQFFSLRQWGKIGPNQMHVTEQLYIHAKIIIVDDRVALIGSANINERSMLGSRDSEVAAVVRDTDLIWSSMAGKPFQVGRFAHTLRMRLMREHVGLPVDEIIEEERNADLEQQEAFESEMDRIYNSGSEGSVKSGPSQANGNLGVPRPPMDRSHSINHDVDLQGGDRSSRSSVSSSSSRNSNYSGDAEIPADPKQKREVEGFGPDHWKEAQKKGLDQGRDSVVINGREFLARDISTEGKGTIESPAASRKSESPHSAEADSVGEGPSRDILPPLDRRNTDQMGLPRANQLPNLPQGDDTDIGGPPLLDANGDPQLSVSHPLAAEIKPAIIHKDCMRDPLDPAFYDDVWNRTADNNTKIYRQVFHCMPDNEVTDWTKYMEFMDHQTRLREAQEGPREAQQNSEQTGQTDQVATEEPPQESTAAGAGISAPGPGPAARSFAEKLQNRNSGGKPLAPLPTGLKKTSTGAHETPARRHARQDSRLDVERAAAAARALNSPMASPAFAPPSNSPFPPAPTTMSDAEKAAAAPEGGNSGNGTVDHSSNLLVPEANERSGEKGERRATFSAPADNSSVSEKPPTSSAGGSTTAVNTITPPIGSVKRRRRATTRGSRHRAQVEDVLSMEQRDGLCGLIQGHLVVFPFDWLIGAEQRGDWLTLVDQAAPLQIYN
ncbi:Phospholipase D1 [Cytospora mali]|uniref:Phospholipase D1 n=1 Tax=Cytospora mali TaxID=578113 RepID=A0A194WDS1_CYTMA|nr:Phospholipase D1 [Valsa mali]